MERGRDEMKQGKSDAIMREWLVGDPVCPEKRNGSVIYFTV